MENTGLINLDQRKPRNCRKTYIHKIRNRNSLYKVQTKLMHRVRIEDLLQSNTENIEISGLDQDGWNFWLSLHRVHHRKEIRKLKKHPTPDRIWIKGVFARDRGSSNFFGGIGKFSLVFDDKPVCPK